ncbi:MAG: bifunctional riboflavin kinase/FAD synthetase [Ruminococcaceae bacterium]|nr:bifunctional riboflavin kinase/FAD synthetase [Oscillospiraceae bacterium]
MTQRKIYALGFFDGVHLGHQALLAACRRLAARLDAIPAAVTFDRHPRALFAPCPPLLQTAEDRQTLLTQYGMKSVRVLPVTAEFLGQSWEEFLETLLRDGAAGFVCGYDFRFGHRGEGNAEKLAAFCRERGLPCVIVPEQTLDGIRISSTHIRRLLEEGDMEEAARFLGHGHRLSGTVVPGRQLGRTIGIPTANLLFPEAVVIPQRGVYACRALAEGKCYGAVTNVGSRPTVGGHQTRAESWILDFEGDLYGKTLTLEFCSFLRPERKFDSLEELKAQIQRDAAQTRALLR